MTDHEARFREFHATNPEVYQELVVLARQALARGKRKIGIGMLWEVMRWGRWLAITGDDEFKLNNNYRSRYARLIMEQEPDLRGIFEIRELKTGTEAEPDTSDLWNL